MFSTATTIVKCIVPIPNRSLSLKTRYKMQSSLWDEVKSVTTKAQKEGWLFSIKTTPEHMKNSGIKVNSVTVRYKKYYFSNLLYNIYFIVLL